MCEVGPDTTRARMIRALRRLEENRDGARGFEKYRLGGKVEGVQLALSYLEDEERLAAWELEGGALARARLIASAESSLAEAHRAVQIAQRELAEVRKDSQ